MNFSFPLLFHSRLGESEELEEQDNDKITLSEDCLNELMTQDCLGRFPVMLFRLEATLRSNNSSINSNSSSSSSGSSGSINKSTVMSLPVSAGDVKQEKTVLVTHAGVKEFSSPTQSIGLPRKVLASLGGNLEAIESISVRFIRLPKGTYAKLRPRHNQFFEVGPVKRCLEENLRYHATLTVGDILTVWFRGKSYEMKVMELKPGNEVTVIDTDLELDLDLSEESALAATAAAASAATASTEAGKVVCTSSASSSSSSTANVQSSLMGTTSSSAAFPTNSTGHTLRASAASTASSSASSIPMDVDEHHLHSFYSYHEALEAEPGSSSGSSSAENGESPKTILTAKIKLPNGKTVIRKFYHQQTILQLFLAVSKEMGLENAAQHTTEQQRLIISTRFPPRSLALTSMRQEELNQTLEGIDIKAATEQFFVSLA